MSTAPPDKSSILIVDDMEENLVALEAVLGSLGQRLVRAHSGEEALKAVLREDFAVILLDVLMPGMDGFETASTIKRLDQTKDVPIILLTGADTDIDYAYRGYAIGAADFLNKPFDPWVLRTKVGVFLDLHRKNRQLAAQAEQLRRLLVTGTIASGVPAGQTVPGRPGGQGGPDGQGGELADVAERLARVEEALRASGTAERDTLADRIADLERAVGGLLRADTRPATGPGADPGTDLAPNR